MQIVRAPVGARPTIRRPFAALHLRARSRSLSIFLLAAAPHPAIAEIRFDWPIYIDPPDAGATIAGLVTADFDMDGQVDLATCVSAYTGHPQSIDFYHNDGGQFSYRNDFHIPVVSFRGLAVGDFNHDHAPDIAWLESTSQLQASTVHLLINDGFGSFTSASDLAIPYETNFLRSLDVDEDGVSDILTCQGDLLDVAYADGTGGFDTVRIDIGDGSGFVDEIRLGDLDADSDLDLFVLHDAAGDGSRHDQSIMCFRNDSSHVFAFAGETGFTVIGPDVGNWSVRGIALGDFDSDGDDDLAAPIINRDGVYHPEVRHHLGQFMNESRDGVLHQSLPTQRFGSHFAEAACIAVSDCEGDGDLDIIAGVESGIFVFENTDRHRGKFAPNAPWAAGRIINETIAVADHTDDGAFDVLVANAQGVSALADVSPRQGLGLAHGRAVRGKICPIVVSNARPNEQVWLAYSTGDPATGAAIPALDGLIPELGRNLSLFGAVRADGSGRAVFRLPVPQNSPRDTVTVQAFVRRGDAGWLSAKSYFGTIAVE